MGVNIHHVKNYLDKRDGSKTIYEDLIAAVIPIYYNEKVNPYGAHYIFNVETSDGAAFEAKLKKQPNRYKKLGPFDGISDTKYRMYRCLW